MKAIKKIKHPGFNTLNHSVPLTITEIILLREERKATIKFYTSLRTPQK
jgi:hypothetical protein